MTFMYLLLTYVRVWLHKMNSYIPRKVLGIEYYQSRKPRAAGKRLALQQIEKFYQYQSFDHQWNFSFLKFNVFINYFIKKMSDNRYYVI
jgi:hypothetical protein